MYLFKLSKILVLTLFLLIVTTEIRVKHEIDADLQAMQDLLMGFSSKKNDQNGKEEGKGNEEGKKNE